MIRPSLFAPMETSTGAVFVRFFEVLYFCRERSRIFQELGISQSQEISLITGCLKPCHYKKYVFLAEHNVKSKQCKYEFFLWAASSRTRVETEELIYPMSSLVAEFGGTLGLFLGFSFISLWDKLNILERLVAFNRKKSGVQSYAPCELTSTS